MQTPASALRRTRRVELAVETGSRSFDDLAKAAVVVAGVVAGIGLLGLSAADDAAGSTVTRTGRAHRVLTVIAARLARQDALAVAEHPADRKSTRLNSSHLVNSDAAFCLKKKKMH